MRNIKIGILEPYDFSERAEGILRDLGEVTKFDGKDIISFLYDKKVLFVRLGYYLGTELLQNANSLEYICTPTTGLNHIDLKETKRKNIKVLSLKGESDFLKRIRATPEHILGLVLSLLRKYKWSFLNTKNNQWDREKYKGNEIYGAKIGIIGLGRIGKIIAKYFKVLGAKVIFYDTDLNIRVPGYTRANSIAELIRFSDIVILCASHEAGVNDNFFSAEYINMLANKYFINAARGELLDEEYLIQKIEDDYFKGIALDVIANETKESNNLSKLLSLAEQRNIIITPHIGGATAESMWKTEEYVAKKLAKILRNDPRNRNYNK